MWHLNKIPKIIHFYWGNEKLSYLRYLSVLSFRKLNPDWTIKIHIPAVLNKQPPAWDTMHQKNININKDYFDQLEKLNVQIIEQDFSQDFDNNAHEVHKCDFLRWKILSEEGGVWSDIDILYVKPITALVENVDDSYQKSIDIFLCCFRKSKHAIGFLMSAGNNVFYRKLYELAKINYNSTQYQCIGSKLIDYNYHSQVKIRKDFGKETTVYFIDPACVYTLQEAEIPMFFSPPEESTLALIDLPTVIGFHWYAGHPLAQEFESQLDCENVDQFDNFLSKIIKIKEYNKCL
jgi:hypothetical protein